VNRGEIRWYTFRAPDKRRPVLLLSRSEVVAQLNEIIVVPVTRTVRGLATEVVLTPDDGMPVVCALTSITSLWLNEIDSAQSSAAYQKPAGRKSPKRYC
jgi:mRNA-degrading endonuclease toxin of MazEF toxin-antitoxin module